MCNLIEIIIHRSTGRTIPDFPSSFSATLVTTAHQVDRVRYCQFDRPKAIAVSYSFKNLCVHICLNCSARNIHPGVV